LSALVKPRRRSIVRRAPPAPPPSRRERKRLEHLRRIREAARTLFAEKGFDRTTTREIAERADIGTGTLFLFVKDKRELLLLVHADRFEAALDRAWRDLPAPSTGLVEQLLFVFERLFRVHDEDQAIARHVIKEQLDVSDRESPHRRRISALLDRLLEQLQQLVAHAQDRGEITDDAPARQIAWNAFAAYVAALHGWLGGWTTAWPALGILRSALELQVRGLSAPPRRQRRKPRGVT
jgi:AcrR family transcriptional regulator